MLKQSEDGVLLPIVYIPTHYNIDMWVEMESETFGGIISIEMIPGDPLKHSFLKRPCSTTDILSHLKVEKNQLAFHSVNLKLSDIHVIINEERNDSKSFVQKDEVVLISFDDNLNFNSLNESNTNLKLVVTYEGKMSEQMEGLYKSKYSPSKFIAVTHMEPTHARKVFPCFDEPFLKATFDITVSVETTQISRVFSNMPLISMESDVIQKDKCWNKHKFLTTPKMSTYLVAVVVGDLQKIQVGDLPTVSGVAVNGKAKQTDYMVAVAIDCLEFLERYFGSKFPLPKLDLIAVPEMSVLAMENWGSIIFRESRLLLRPGQDSTNAMIAGCRTLCHELAHSWFGNLVTPEWWCDLWLKEGFARFTEFVCCDYLFPQWKVWSLFDNSVYAAALELDALPSTHAIEMPLAHVNDISQIFDTVSYAKAASVIRMTANWIGGANYHRSTSQFIQKFSGENAASFDWWTSLGDTIRDQLRDWTLQEGYPLITVAAERNEAGRIVALNFSQQRFWSDADDAKAHANENTLWHVPVVFACGNAYKRYVDERGHEQQLFALPEKTDNDNVTIAPLPELGQVGTARQHSALSCVMLPRQTHTRVVLNDCDDDDDDDLHNFVVVNVAQIGFYRVLYDESLLAELAKAMNSKLLSLQDRYYLWDNVFSMISPGLISFASLVAFLPALKEESDFDTWRVINNGFSQLRSQFEYNSSAAKALKDLFRSVTDQAFQHLCGGACEQQLPLFKPPSNDENDNNDNESKPLSDREIAAQAFVPCRAIVRWILGFVGHETVEQWALSLFDENEAPPHIRTLIYTIAIKRYGQRAFDRIWQEYLDASSSQTKSQLLGCFQSTTSVEMFQFLLEQMKSGVVPRSNFRTLLYFECPHAERGLLAWQWLSAEWNGVLQSLRPVERGGLFECVAQGYVTDRQRLATLSAFVDALPDEDKTVQVTRAVTNASAALRFAEKYGEQIVTQTEKFLKQ